LIGFENEHLALAAFVSPGSLVVEIQKPEYVSRSALVSAGMGMNTHVVIEKDGVIDVNQLADFIKRNGK
jgi:hypothetical protein